MSLTQFNAKLTDYNIPWISQRADPYVYHHSNNKYYFTASVPEYDRIVLREGENLESLRSAQEHVVWGKHNSGIMSKHVWAPEIHYLDRKWYIYFAAGEMEDVWKIRPYVLMCDDEDPISGKWIELGKMQRADQDEFSFEAFSLDATVFEACGKHYFIWAEKIGVGKQISNLYIAELETPNKLKTVQVLLTTPDYDWERYEFWVNEGPAAIKKDGKIFVTYSASSTGMNYCVGMLSIDEDKDPLDPSNWIKKSKPVLATDIEQGIYGPGHNSFTTSRDGRDIMVFHGRQYSDIIGNPLYDSNRQAMLLEVRWQDHEPIFEFMPSSEYKNL